MSNDRYQDPMANGEPHPLKDMPQAILDVARGSMREVADARDVTRDQIEPIADFIVLELHEAGHINTHPLMQIDAEGNASMVRDFPVLHSIDVEELHAELREAVEIIQAFALQAKDPGAGTAAWLYRNRKWKHERKPCQHPIAARDKAMLQDPGDVTTAYCNSCSCVIKLIDGEWVAQPTGPTKITTSKR